MIWINRANEGEKAYVVSVGKGKDYENNFTVFARNEDEALDRLCNLLVARKDLCLHLDAFTVNMMSPECKNEMQLRHCPQYNIYLPNVEIKEVSI